MSQDNKYSIDVLLKFAFTVGLVLIVFNTIIAYPKYIFSMFPFIRQPILFICNKLPEICLHPYLIKLLYYTIFTLISFGIEIKKIPSTIQKKVAMFIGITIVVTTDYWLHINFTALSHLIHSSISLFLYVLFLVLIRRHFFYFSKKDQFNEKNEEFNQTKKLMTNPYSVNIKLRDGWINVINPFRGCIVMEPQALVKHSQ